MPENETLDLRQSVRWKRARQLIENGASPEDISTEVLRSLCAIMKRLPRLIPMGRLIEASITPDGDPWKLLPACRRAADYAEAIVQLGPACKTDVELIEALHLHIVAAFFDQMPLTLSFSGQGMSAERFRDLKAQTLAAVAVQISRLARDDAARLRKEPLRRSGVVSRPSQGEMLEMSLL